MTYFTNLRRPARWAGLLAALLALPLAGQAQVAFTNGNVVVVQSGDGAAALTSAAALVSLNEYTTTGTAVQSFALPSTGTNPITIAGSSTSEGSLFLSTDGQYLTLAGYKAVAGTTGVAATASTATNRVVGRINSGATVDVSTQLTDAYTALAFRSAASVDGSAFWLTGANQGVRYTTLGATTSVVTSSTVTNLRVVGVFGGDVYYTTGSGTVGLYKVPGLATTGPVAATNIAVIGGSSPSPYGFALLDMDPLVAGVDVAYVADDRTNASGGIYKFSYDGTTWTARGQLSSTAGLRYLTAKAVGSTVQLYATSSASLYSVTDAAAYNATFSGTLSAALATAATNKAFRGVAFAPQAIVANSTSISSISTTPVCATTATNVTVNYTTTGTFTGTYSAELSDASGTFPGTALTTVSGTAGSSIVVTIPAGTASGTGYKIRVNNTTPATTGNGSNAFTIVSNPTVAVAPATAQSIPTNTNGTALTGTETPATGNTRQWYYGTTAGGPYNTAISGATGTSYIPNFATAGTYYVVLKTTFAACSAVTSNAVTVTVTAPVLNPEINVQQPAGTDYLTGSTFNFASTAIGGTTPVTFTIQNTAATDALTINSLNVTGTGFALSGTAPTTVAAGSSATFTVNFAPTGAAGPRTGLITINNNDQDESSYTINLTGTASAGPPTLTSTSPTAAVAGQSSTFTFTGTNFVSGATTVNFSGGTVTSVTYVSATSLTVVLVPTASTSSSTATVSVTTASGTSATKNLTIVGNPGGFFEPFELGSKTGYATATVTFTTGPWVLANTLLGNSATDRFNNTQAPRLASSSTNSPATTNELTMNFDKLNGAGVISLLAGRFGTDAVGSMVVEVSNNGGTTWTAYSSGPTVIATATLDRYTFGANVSGNIRVRFRNLATAATATSPRFNIDDVQITDYVAPTGNSLVVSGTENISGTFNNVTVGSSGVATVVGPLTVNTALAVQNGGTLNTNCQTIGGTGSFTLASGTTLGVCNVDGIAATGAMGAVQMIGTRTFSNDANYVYNGTVAQTTGTGLPTTVRNLTVNNTATVTTNRTLMLNNPVAVRQVLALTSGNLLTGSQMLTLLSASGQGTALIDNTGGVVVGTGTMQRAVDVVLTGDNIGYHHYSSPVMTETVGTLAAPGFAPVLNDATSNPDFNSARLVGVVRPFPTVFGYDETRVGNNAVAQDQTPFNQGYFAPADATAAWQPGKGYSANVPNAVTVDFVGTFNNAPTATAFAGLTGLTRGGTGDSGWQLLGNPFPSPLNFGPATGGASAFLFTGPLNPTGQTTNLDGSIYQYHSTSRYGGYFTTYLGSADPNAPSGIGQQPVVPAGGGFFMRVTNPGLPTGELRLSNANRVTAFGTQPVFGRAASASTRPTLRLQLAGASLTDDAYLYFEPQATTGPDAAYDAVKMPNPNGLNLATRAGITQLAIDGRPAPTTATLLPLFVAVPATGTYTLTAAELSDFASTPVYLRDALTGTRILLAAGTTYRFTTATASVAGRFALEFAPAGAALATAAQALAAQMQLYPNPASGRFHITLPAGTKAATAVLTNALGQTVLTRSLTGSEADFSVATAGVYTLRLTLDGTTVTRKVVVE